MQDYKKIYDSNEVTLFSAYEDYGAYVFRVELKNNLFSGLNFGFSGAALFYIGTNREEDCCEKLRKMYGSLNGECLIQDCEFGNEIKLYFEGRYLRMEGRFHESNQSLQFCCDVDQTIIPRLISLLQDK